MSVEFSENENRQLGTIFPGKLFSKLVTVIRDAILGAPKLEERVCEIIDKRAPTRAEFESLKTNVEDFLTAIEVVVEKDAVAAPQAEPEEDNEVAAPSKSQPEPEAKPTKPEKGSARNKMTAMSEFVQDTEENGG